MRKQYYFRPSDRGLLAWDVDRLVRLSRRLPRKIVPLTGIRELAEDWFGGDERPTWRALLQHVKLIEDADLSFPIVLSASGAVMDGMHRVAKAALQGRHGIEAVQFDEDPEPDHVGPGPADLAYDEAVASEHEFAPGPSDLAAIEELERRWLACELAGRAWDVLDLCSDDIVWLPPGRPPIQGKAAIRAWLETSRDRLEDVRVSDVAVGGDGLQAYKLANFRTRYVPYGSSDAVTVRGWHFWVLRRQAGSAWRVAFVSWSVQG